MRIQPAPFALLLLFSLACEPQSGVLSSPLDASTPLSPADAAAAADTGAQAPADAQANERFLTDPPRVYADREARYVEVPARYAGYRALETVYAHYNIQAEEEVSFSIEQASSILVLMQAHREAADMPPWMAGFTPSAEIIESDHGVRYRIWRKDFPAGKVVLGGTAPPDQSKRLDFVMYSVWVPPRAGYLEALVPEIYGWNVLGSAHDANVEAPARAVRFLHWDAPEAQRPDATELVGQEWLDPDAFQRALDQARPGDKIGLRDGDYRNVRFEISRSGTLQAPIRIYTERVGGVVLRGDWSIEISGDYVVWNGGRALGMRTTAHPIRFYRSQDQVARHSRLTNFTFDGVDRADRCASANHWVYLLYAADYCRVDHCRFSNKQDAGHAIRSVFDGPGGRPGRYQRIDHNLFDKLYTETPCDKHTNPLQLGDPAGPERPSMFALFDHNVVSDAHNNGGRHSGGGGRHTINSKANYVFNIANVVERSFVDLQVRKGHHCVFDSNWVLGGDIRDGVLAAEGLSVLDRGHIIVNNYVAGFNAGSASSERYGLRWNSQDTSDSSRYRVEDCLVAFNTFYGGSRVLGYSAEPDRQRARRCTVAFNAAHGTADSAIFRLKNGSATPQEFVWEGNVFYTEFGDSVERRWGYSPIPRGVQISDPALEKGAEDRIARPGADSPLIGGAGAGFRGVIYDAEGQIRDPLARDVGADQRQHETPGPLPIFQGAGPQGVD